MKKQILIFIGILIFVTIICGTASAVDTTTQDLFDSDSGNTMGDMDVDEYGNLNLVYVHVNTYNSGYDTISDNNLIYRNGTKETTLAQTQTIYDYNSTGYLLGISGSTISNPKIAIGPENTIHITYDQTPHAGHTTTKYIYKDQNGWSTVTDLFDSDSGNTMGDMDVDEYGNLNLVYVHVNTYNSGYDTISDNNLIYRNGTKETTLAQTQTIFYSDSTGYLLGISGSTISNPKIAIGPENTIHITYDQTPHAGHTTTKYIYIDAKLPIILVYGWQGSDENWTMLKGMLEEDGYPVYVLDYDMTKDATIGAAALQSKVLEVLALSGCSQVNIIAHSFGGLVARYYIENETMNGDKYVANLVMLGTPNHGAPLADYLTGEKWNSQANSILDYLLLTYASIFRLDKDWGSTLNLRTINNTFLEELNAAFDPDNIDTNYYVITGTGHFGTGILKAFGDLSSSALITPGLDDGVVPLLSAQLTGVPLYAVDLNHCELTNPTDELYNNVIIRILQGNAPDPSSVDMDIPTEEDPADYAALPNIISVTDNIINPDGVITKTINVISGTLKSIFQIIWPGSDLDLVLIDPNGHEITPLVAESDPNIEFTGDSTSEQYTILNPMMGNWTMKIVAIDVANDGENYIDSYFADYAPTIQSTNPKNGATSLNSDSTITVTFSEAIKEYTGWIELQNSAKIAIPFTTSINGNVLIITPSNTLLEDRYKLILHTGSVSDLDGNLLAAKSIYFTVGNPPTITSTNPTNGATNINPAKTITVTFSEAIRKSNSFFVELLNSTGTAIDFTTYITGGNILVINPTNDLAEDRYKLILHTGCVTDLAGNLLAAKSIYFSVGTSPAITSTTPLAGANNVNVAKTITVTFNETIKKSRNFWIEVVDSTGNAVAYNSYITSGNILVIDPIDNLAANTTYKVKLHTGCVTDLAGNPVALSIFSFTTQNT